jgi:homopolymeric O-antigen transport system permease protein
VIHVGSKGNIPVMLHTPPDYELIIRPTRGWFRLNLGEIWRYRDLLFLLVYRDFVSKYKQTVLGPAWFVLQPLLTTLVFTVVFAGAVKIPTDGLPPVLFYFAGLLGWNYFAQTFQNTSATLVNNASIFGKVYFPRLVAPLSIVLSNALTFGLQFVTFLCLWFYFKYFTGGGAQFGFSAAIIWLPLLMLQIAALSFGVGLWLTALTAKYRDFALLSGFLIQLWLYATPVIYPLSQIPDRWQWLAVINPMATPIEAIRYMFLRQGVVVPSHLAMSAGVTLFMLVSGVLVFNKIEKTFVDTV